MNVEDKPAVQAGNTSSTESVPARKPASFFQERPPQVMEVAPQLLRRWTRRNLLFFGAGAVAAVAVPAPILGCVGQVAVLGDDYRDTGGASLSEPALAFPLV